MSERTSKKSLIVLLVVAGITLQACSSGNSGPSTGVPDASQPAPAVSPKTPFERDMQFIRNGQFTYVWVFSRKDGKAIDRDDAAFLRRSAPQVVDWVTADEGKRVIGGTNFDLEKGGLPELRKRFVVEDYSGK